MSDAFMILAGLAIGLWSLIALLIHESRQGR